MGFENYWGLSENLQDDVKVTDNIYKIIEKQCEYLSQYTHGKVFAVFDEMKIVNTMPLKSQYEKNLLKYVDNVRSIP